MSVGLWQTPARITPICIDRVVIGAGLIGSYLLWRLSEDQQSSVLLDSRHVAGGASGRNGGLLLTGIAHSYAAAVNQYGRERTRQLWALTIENREAMMKLAQRYATPVRRCGSFILGYSPDEAVELCESVELLHEDGFTADWYADDPLKRGFYGAIGNQSDGAIQPALLTQALVQASGTRLAEAHEVYELRSTDDGVLVYHRNGVFLTQQVVVATNAWTSTILPEFSDLLVPGRGQILATAPVEPMLHQAAYADYGFVYFQQSFDGRFVLGGFRNHAFAEEETFVDAVTPTIQNDLEAFLARYFPELVDVPIERRWSGTMSFTPDGLPLVGRLRRDPRIAFAVGFNGHGLGLGIVAADQLLAEIRHQPPSHALFSARRLVDWAI